MNREARIFAEWFAIRPEPARLLAVLFEAGGETVSHEALRDRLRASLTGVRSSMVRLREAMDEGSLMALYGLGYRLTSIGLRDCRRALVDAQTRRAA